ncbi:MAG: hypothetical protein JW772_01635 [Candidatus Diapherotrites archaeon]|nr:hypothetical protein [Candidatus Diapherotrites archaeon]
MAIDPIVTVLNIADLLVLTLMIAIPVFIVALVALFLRERISKKFEMSWIKSTLITTYVFVLLISALAYVSPYYSAFSESEIASQEQPVVLATTPADVAVAFFLTVLRILVVALLFTLLLLPLQFFATFLMDKLAEKKFPKPAKVFAATYFTCLLALIIMFFVFPWIIPGLMFLFFWGF